MATIEMTCVVPNCDMGEGAPYKTEKVDAAMAWAMIQTHIGLAHGNLTQADTVREPRPQAERVKRPMLTLTGQCGGPGGPWAWSQGGSHAAPVPGASVLGTFQCLYLVCSSG